MLSWRELPSCRILGSSPVWYQTGTKVIALSEFFVSATQEHSYASLTAVESSADAASGQIRLVCVGSLTTVESFADTAPQLLRVAVQTVLAAKESSLDAFSSTAKCTSSAKLTAVHSCADILTSSIRALASVSLSCEDSASDAASGSISGPNVVDLSTAEASVDTLSSEIHVFCACALTTVDPIADACVVCVGVPDGAVFAAIESFTDAATCTVSHVDCCSLSVTEFGIDIVNIHVLAHVFVSVVAQELCPDHASFTVLFGTSVRCAMQEPFTDSVQAQIKQANLHTAQVITLAVTRPAQLAIRASKTPLQDIKAGRPQCNLSASRSSIYLQAHAPAELSLTAVKRV